MRAMLGLSRHRFRIMHLCTTAKAFAPTDTNGTLIVDWPWVLIPRHPFKIIFFTSLRHPVFLSFLCTFIMTSFGFRMESHLISFHFIFYPPFCCITSLHFLIFRLFLFLIISLFIFTFHISYNLNILPSPNWDLYCNRQHTSRNMGVLLPLHPPMSRR